MKKILVLLSFLMPAILLVAQDTLSNAEGSKYQFIKVVNLEALPVQNQSITGTCWSFSALSFMESEMMRMGKEGINLSEMFVVNHAYKDKARKYIRMHGALNFGPGGAFHDIPYVIRNYGIVPEEVYNGINYGGTRHDHRELDKIMQAMVDAIKSNPAKKLTPAWDDAVQSVLNSYLGAIPESFEYRGKEYTPKSFAESTGLNMDDYIEISSYTHHPFYSRFILEVPDNWMWGSVFNVPLDDLVRIIDHALENGYTVAWAADVSEKGFSFRKGLAIVPEDPATLDPKDETIPNAFLEPVPEKKITQEMRQEAFDNYETTDDHGMQITGLYKDAEGNKFYFVKNSWGTSNFDQGYFFASEAYVRYKTMDIMIHKNALPKDLRKKLKD